MVNEYWPQCGDALWLGSRLRMGWLIPFVDERMGGQ